MKRSAWIAFLLTVFCLMTTVAFSAEWFLFFEQDTYRYYIDKASMQRTPEDTILVWDKFESTDNTLLNLSVQSLHEVDCSHRRYRWLQDMSWKIPSNEDLKMRKIWHYFDPSDHDRAYLAVMCGKDMKK